MSLYHIDTDMGVDDGLALFLADKALPDALALSTVFGNVPVTVATRNAMLFRELLGRTTKLPIFMGADRASDGLSPDARKIHGEDGLGGATRQLDAGLLEEISSTAPEHFEDAPPPKGEPVTLIGIGPATNIPRLVAWYGHSLISRIILMSGAFFDLGNITPTAEFNAHCDPFALLETLDLGIPTTLVPLDVCRKVQITRSAIQTLRDVDRSALANLVVGSHMRYMDFYREWEGFDGCFPHDSLAVLAALAPEHFFTVRGLVTIECTPPNRGRTTFAPATSSHVEVVTGGKLKWAREVLADLLNGLMIPADRRGR